jgi:hypothetical protein
VLNIARIAACTCAAGTQLNTWGENPAAQEGAAALVDAAEAAGQAAVGQGYLVGGIALPPLMHTRGATVGGQAPWARRRRAEVELHEPALQRPRAGQLNVGEALSWEVLGQDDADELGAPVGVVTAQRLRLEEDGVVGQAKRGRGGAMVSGSGHAAVAETRLAE